MSLGFHRLRVAAVERLTSESATITFEVPAELKDAFRFSAGQHLTLRREAAGEDLRRTYSVCTSAVDGPLRVAVKRLEGGVVSTWLLDELRAGDELEVLPPGGSFGPKLDSSRRRRYGLIAAGSGITPIIAIAATALEVEPASEVVLLFGNRTTADVMFLEELADLKDRYPARLQLLHLLSREVQESELLSGRLDGDRLRRVLSELVPVDSVDEWYLCGPFGMVTDGRAVLLEAGAAEVHVELFHAEAPPPRPARAEGEVVGETSLVAVLNGRASTLWVPRDQRILDAVLAVRSDAPYACKGGVCGTCRARLVTGSVEMVVNYALEAEEVEAGIILTCQAISTSDELRVEFV